jgi:hypothetical protein
LGGGIAVLGGTSCLSSEVGTHVVAREGAIVGIVAGHNAVPKLGPLFLGVQLEVSHHIPRCKYFVGEVGKFVHPQVVLGEY